MTKSTNVKQEAWNDKRDYSLGRVLRSNPGENFLPGQVRLFKNKLNPHMNKVKQQLTKYSIKSCCILLKMRSPSLKRERFFLHERVKNNLADFLFQVLDHQLSFL